MATFQAKITWERLRNRKKKKKKIVPMSSYQTRNRKFQKHSTKIQKFKKRHYGFSSSQNKLGKAKKEKKKKIVPMSFYATRDRKFQNK